MPNLDGVNEQVRSLSVIAQLSFDIVGHPVRGILYVSFVVQVLEVALLLSYNLFDRLALNAK
jgi:hypothetical protein